jgi:phosphoribosylanthranilate isomerase
MQQTSAMASPGCGVEVSKGIKSADLIHEFCRAVRRADAELTR